MAQMIPATIPEDTPSRAERDLFPLLQEGLDDGYTVFHSLPLLTRTKQDRFLEGEIDFLIFHPARGFLVLEAKSGSIRYDGDRQTWFQNDRPLERSPFDQARSAKYKLRDYLRDRLGYVPPITFAHAACFPDVFTNVRDLPIGADPSICLTARDLIAIGPVVSGIIAGFKTEGVRPLDQKETDDIRRVLVPHFEYGTSLIDRMGRAERRIFSLTENQCRMLEFIGRHREALIEGCAGSGKTVMAVKKARELAAGGKTVLLLAYNLMIGEHLAKEVRGITNITACAYHRFCEDVLKAADRLPSYRNHPDYWAFDLPDAFGEVVNESGIKYDAVIVDEGQDFRIEWWVTIADLVKPGGHFYIFYDPAQNLWATQMAFPVSGEPFVLTDNCRNTRAVFQKMEPYVERGMRLMDAAPDGDQVEEYRLPDPRERRRTLGRILHRLVNEQGLARERIVILGGHSMGKTCIGDDHRIGNFRISEDPEEGPGVVHYHTYMKFKGCEADAVILLDVDPQDARWGNTALYTAISRARHTLCIIWVR